MKKKFNLDMWLEDNSLKTVTRDGRAARIVYTDMKGMYPVVAVVSKTLCESDQESVNLYTENGELMKGAKSDGDLFFDDGNPLDEFQEEVKKLMYYYSNVTPSDEEVAIEAGKLSELYEKVYKK